MAVAPDAPNVQRRLMFGMAATFAGGNMFAGLYESSMTLRLPADKRARIHGARGGAAVRAHAGPGDEGTRGRARSDAGRPRDPLEVGEGPPRIRLGATGQAGGYWTTPASRSFVTSSPASPASRK